jgi:hypothetical protein
VWLLGWAAEGKIPLKKLRSLKLGAAGEGLWGVGHLWFLEYLFLFCAAAWGMQQLAAWWMARRAAVESADDTSPKRQRGSWTSIPSLALSGTEVAEFSQNSGVECTDDARILGEFGYSLTSKPALRAGVMVRSFWLPFLLAVPSAVALWWEPRIVIGFRHSWHPLAANLLYYAPCFAGGWWLYRRHRAGGLVTRFVPWHLVLAAICFVALLPLIRAHVVTEFAGPRRIVLAALFAGFAWLSAVGWFGLCLRRFPPPPRVVQYLSAASFWVYLFHHPVVGLAQVALAGSALSAGMKFVIVTVTGVGLSLLTYEVGVRYTWVGALLNGRRESRGDAPPATLSARNQHVRRAA